MKKIGILNIILTLLGGWLIYNGFNAHSKNEELVKEASSVIDVKADKLDSKNEGKIVCLSGTIDVDHNLIDSTLGISMPSLKLKRIVEMYQWEEDCDDNCSYKKVWSEDVINSEDFEENHENPDTMPYESKEFIYKGKIGDYEIGAELVSKLSYDKKINQEDLQGKYNYYGNLNIDGSYLKNYNETPQIGNFRITYKYTENGEITVLGVQKGNTIESFKSSKGKELYMIKKGKYTGKQMLNVYTKNSGNGRIFSSIIGGIILLIGISPLIPKKSNNE